ncbi:cysteine methyltransferase [Chryseobacterium sp. SSA4.19]|uniref:hypothetical protein n=1 Tax=Chryseobacterium sp. SSA4.19 TaxID=2919915 RepID=UPI001F4E4A47|nr:hypothetical protein [Chryseobacterium sp. SSA4.19]MCJ8152235.1 cysteine methyltransferase [Chryseobacterium sp. SSA4.19]
MAATSQNIQGVQSNLNLPKKELILEIELNGKMKFEYLMDVIYRQLGICHKVLSVNVEYINGRSFGSVQLYLNINSADFEQLEYYLYQNKLLSTTVEYVCRKYL